MKLDFTIEIYKQLLKSFLDQSFQLIPFKEYFNQPSQKFIILRHDVDARKLNSLLFATIQYDLGIKGTYYFRAVPQSFDEQIILRIAAMGHEIGYHYENLITSNGNVDQAYEEFCVNLEKFRKLYPVTTICMHGSPKSRLDSKDLWSKYDYRKLGIIGEPYFDVDFSRVFYLTDTGRRWDGYYVSIRDKIPVHQTRWEKEGLVFHSTSDIINSSDHKFLPHQIMMTFHPQRWHSNALLWVEELVLQNTKNIIKQYLINNNSM
jgi:hypothetical protein